MNLIEAKNCSIKNGGKTYIDDFSWEMNVLESWLLIGDNSSGKNHLVDALSGKLEFCTERKNSFFSSAFGKNVTVVSLENAASLIEEERNRDESEYMDREDVGRTGRAYISEVLGGSSKKNAPLPEIAWKLETLPEVKLCGVEKILDRGLRYMSTGEIRRTLLCRALLSGAGLIILSNPFAGLDAESRKILFEFFNTIAERQKSSSSLKSVFPRIILCSDRFVEIPEGIDHVLEFDGKKVSFSGSRVEYEKICEAREKEKNAGREKRKSDFLESLAAIRKEGSVITDSINSTDVSSSLVRFEDVNVGWDEKLVLENVSFEIKKGEHFLVRGPNGSGKTTIMELITGDNMQVFREKVFIFGSRRGSGESIWDIKKNLGIVSYRLHVEYRMVGGTELQNVIVSGFKDSIGLYEKPTDVELSIAKAWLKLGGFQGRERETFSSLSYGEQRAVLILRAAAKSPKLMILDEPCHGLDDGFREKVLDLLETIAETGLTTLLHVTHEESEILPCEKKVLELCPGKNPMYRIYER